MASRVEVLQKLSKQIHILKFKPVLVLPEVSCDKVTILQRGNACRSHAMEDTYGSAVFDQIGQKYFFGLRCNECA